MAKTTITKFLRSQSNINMLRTLNIEFSDEVNQLSVEVMSIVDNITQDLRF